MAQSVHRRDHWRGSRSAGRIIAAIPGGAIGEAVASVYRSRLAATVRWKSEVARHDWIKKPGILPGWRKASHARRRIKVSACPSAALTLNCGSRQSSKPLEASARRRAPFSRSSTFVDQAVLTVHHRKSLSTPKGAWEIGPALPFSMIRFHPRGTQLRLTSEVTTAGHSRSRKEGSLNASSDALPHPQHPSRILESLQRASAFRPGRSSQPYSKN